MLPPRIPVIMYHGISRPLPGWLWGHLITDITLFERQIALLKRHGYRAVGLDRLREHQESGRAEAPREVVLTFDDGYLDNWVFAYPILKREGWCGTIYVNPEFIDPGEQPRPTLEDVWAGRCRLEDLPAHGFLNRAELRLLQASGVMVIGSHSMSHTWYPTGPRIVDFHRPGLPTPWLAWNARPDRKHAYLTEDQDAFVPWGTPIHEHGRSLGVRRWIPDAAIADAAVAACAAGGGASFFAAGEWRARLDAAIAGLADRGRLETDQEMYARFTYELQDSRRLLEEILETPVHHFCWPGGAYNDDSWPLAEAAGYRTICVARRDGRRWADADPALVRRISAGDHFSFRGGRYRASDPRFLLYACEVETGRAWQRWPLRALKALTAARAGFRSVNE